MALTTAGTASARRPAVDGGPLGQTPRTHGATVVGWLLVCFSIAPLAMAAADRRASEAWVGAGMLTAGIASILIGRRLGRR